MAADSIVGVNILKSKEKIDILSQNSTYGTDSYENIEIDLKAVFDNSYDVIYVSDGNGKTLRVSAACERLWGYKAKDLIGRNVYELEKEKIFNPSITKMVLEAGHQVQAIQTTKTGYILMVVGTPIRDENDKIYRVVNFSRDISHESILETELRDLKNLIDGYRQELKQLRPFKDIETDTIIVSASLKNIFALSKKAAKVDSTVLITGESGSGKEVVANYIHQKSERSQKPFIKINCGAIPETLLESELFGYKKGAFTGASKKGKKGMFELANTGTIFLDEIGELPLSLQVKLFRVIQEEEVVPIGGTEPVKLSVRIIAATSKNLKKLIENNSFREELYYRLNVIPLEIPPLRERKDDIKPLITHFVNKFSKKYKNGTLYFSNKLNKRLENYHWPGNVRELKNIIERIVVLSDNDIADESYLPKIIHQKNSETFPVEVNKILPVKQILNMAEKKLLERVVQKFKTNEEIAKQLQVNQSTISRKLKKYNIRKNVR